MTMMTTTILYYGRIVITDLRERVKQKDGQTDRRETDGRGEADMETARGRTAVQTNVSDAAAKAEETCPFQGSVSLGDGWTPKPITVAQSCIRQAGTHPSRK